MIINNEYDINDNNNEINEILLILLMIMWSINIDNDND